jgi:hypothetical protein
MRIILGVGSFLIVVVIAIVMVINEVLRNRKSRKAGQVR